jgi:hypothetical protein
MSTDENKIHVQDFGVIFEVTIVEGGVAVDISAATTLTIKFKKPGGSTLTKTAVLSGTGVDGKMRYTTVSGELDQVGLWEIQAYLVSPSWTLSSSTEHFEVFPNL